MPDPGNMRGLIANMGDHVRDAVKIMQTHHNGLQALPRAEQLSSIVVCGMGGSAIGGDLAAAYVERESPIPIRVVRSFSLPHFVDAASLAIVSSYSGNTAEALALYKEARTRGLQCICVSTGGELARRARANGDLFIALPAGMQPRAALAYGFIPLLIIFSEVLDLPRLEALDEVANALDQWAAIRVSETSDEAALAKQLIGKIAVIYSSNALETVNLRWRGQLQENANHLAFGNVLPEFAHNEINSWEFPQDLLARMHVIALTNEVDDDPRLTEKLRAVTQLLERRGVEVSYVAAMGETKLERIFSLISSADWTSYHLAMEQGVDPTPIPAIEDLKRQR